MSSDPDFLEFQKIVRLKFRMTGHVRPSVTRCAEGLVTVQTLVGF